MESIKINIPFVNSKSLQYIIKKERYVLLEPSFFKYHSEYTIEVEDDVKGKVEQYHNYNYTCKRSVIGGIETDHVEDDDMWYCDLLILGASDFRIWFKTAQQLLEFTNRIEPYIYTEVFEMKPLLQ